MSTQHEHRLLDDDEVTPPPLRRLTPWEQAKQLIIEEAERRPLNHDEQKKLEDAE